MPRLGIKGVLGKLNAEQRIEAEETISLIVDDPDAAAYEIVALRARVADLEDRISYLKGEIGKHRDSWQVAEDRVARLEAALLEMPQQIPVTWLDPLLSGPDGIRPLSGSWTGLEIERLLRTLRARLEDYSRKAVEVKP